MEGLTEYLFKYLARLLFFKYSLKYWKYDSVAQQVEHNTYTAACICEQVSWYDRELVYRRHEIRNSQMDEKEGVLQ